MAKQKQAVVKKIRVASKGNTTVAKPSFTLDASGKVLKLALDNYPPQRTGSVDKDRSAMQKYRNEYRKYQKCGHVPSTWGEVFKAAGALRDAKAAFRNPEKFSGFTLTLNAL